MMLMLKLKPPMHGPLFQQQQQKEPAKCIPQLDEGTVGTLRHPSLKTSLEMLQGQKGLMEGHCAVPGKLAGFLKQFISDSRLLAY